MIRLAQAADLPGIKRLWMAAFADSEAATDFYFDNRMPREKLLDNLLVDTKGGELRGMLSMLPIELVSGGKSYAARYFFAIATDERFRRRGISTRLIEEAERETLARGGHASLLVPASDALFDFYGKRGFDSFFYYLPVRYEGENIGGCPEGARLLPPEPGALLRLRDAAFGTSSLYARWDEEAMGFIARASAAWGAPLLRFELDGGEGYAYCEPDGDGFVIKELALDGIDRDRALAIIHSELGGQWYLARHAGVPGAEMTAYGMIRWLKPTPAMPPGQSPYLGLGKD